MGSYWGSGDSSSIKQRMAANIKRRKKFVARLLVARREELGISQRTLGVMLGVPQTRISRVERAEADIDFVLLETWAAALDTDLKDFRTVSKNVRARLPWAPAEPHFRLRTHAEWKYFARRRRWPAVKGFGAFVSGKGMVAGVRGTPWESDLDARGRLPNGSILELYRWLEAKRKGIIVDTDFVVTNPADNEEGDPSGSPE